MHIPDGFLSPPVYGTLYAVSTIAVGSAIRNINADPTDERIFKAGVLTAFVFAAQMVNVPVMAGTSGHLLGGLLLAILLGPSLALVTMSVVLILQCFLFQDGGLTALGANVFNMAIIAGLGGFMLYRGLERILPSGRVWKWISISTAGVIGVEAAATAVALELSISGTASLAPALAAMLLVHLPIGIFEGLITAAVVEFLENERYGLIKHGA